MYCERRVQTTQCHVERQLTVSLSADCARNYISCERESLILERASTRRQQDGTKRPSEGSVLKSRVQSPPRAVQCRAGGRGAERGDRTVRDENCK